MHRNETSRSSRHEPIDICRSTSAGATGAAGSRRPVAPLKGRGPPGSHVGCRSATAAMWKNDPAKSVVKQGVRLRAVTASTLRGHLWGHIRMAADKIFVDTDA